VLPRRHGSARRRDRAAYAAAVALGVGVAVRPAEEGFQPTARALIPRPRIGVRRVTAESGGGGSLASRLHLRDAIREVDDKLRPVRDLLNRSRRFLDDYGRDITGGADDE